MLKISQAGRAQHSVTLRLEGRIVGPWVVELRRLCEAALAEGHALQLHLAEVEYMDRDGIALLSGLRTQGVSLTEAPPFVSAQLKIRTE